MSARQDMKHHRVTPGAIAAPVPATKVAVKVLSIDKVDDYVIQQCCKSPLADTHDVRY
jgi:hypothetical protein